MERGLEKKNNIQRFLYNFKSLITIVFSSRHQNKTRYCTKTQTLYIKACRV